MPKVRPSIAAEWQGYRIICLPKDAGKNQLEGTRNAFYAGFSAALRIVSGIGEPNVDEDEGVAILDSLHVEMMHYVDALRMRGARTGGSV